MNTTNAATLDGQVKDLTSLYITVAVPHYLKRLTLKFILETIFSVLIPLIAAILVGIFASIAGFLTTLGVGGINFVEKLTQGKSLVIKYWSTRSTIEDSIIDIYVHEKSTDHSNVEQLTTLKTLVEQYLKNVLNPKSPPA